MRLLADEDCDFAVVKALRADGHDVLAVAQTAPGVTDDRVLAIAAAERRVVITEDKDFGRLVYASAAGSDGVILIRFPGGARATLPAVVVEPLRSSEARLAGAFTVVEPGRVRIRRRPGR